MSNIRKKYINVTLDENSLRDAATLVKMYKNKFPLAIKRAMYNLAWDLEPMIQKDFAYEGYVPGIGATPDVVVAPVIDNDGYGFTIKVQGEQVGFLEFGAGLPSDHTHPLAKNAPFEVYTGSFSLSADGAGTWQEWIESGKDPNKYPFNREPRYGLLHASEYIKKNYMKYITRELRSITL